MSLVNGYAAVFNEEIMVEDYFQKQLAISCTFSVAGPSTLNDFSVQEFFYFEVKIRLMTD